MVGYGRVRQAADVLRVSSDIEEDRWKRPDHSLWHEAKFDFLDVADFGDVKEVLDFKKVNTYLDLLAFNDFNDFNDFSEDVDFYFVTS